MRYPTRSVGDTTLVASRVVSTAPCKLAAIVGLSDGTAAYMMVFEASSVPGNGTAGKFCIKCTTGAANNFSFSLDTAVDMDAVTVVPSSTPDTLTAVAGNHQSIQGLLAG